MDFARVIVPVAPVRRKARHQSEMVSQLLFGEAVRILKGKKDIWVKVRSLHDQYEGWMTDTLLTAVTEGEAAEAPEFLTVDLMNEITSPSGRMLLPLGASLPGFRDGSLQIGNKTFSYSGNAGQRLTESPSADQVKTLAERWLNAPYCWGGRTIYGVDCSGFVQVNYRILGLDLPRDAWQQAQLGHTIKKLADARCGDLAFFDDRDEIVHVGILLGPDTIIHASGRVRVDGIDKKGIVQSDTGKRTHRLKSIKRYW